MIAAFLRKMCRNGIDLKKNYQSTFDLKKDCVRVTLADLREFCNPDLMANAGNPVDPIKLGVAIGREQVAKRIFEMLKINEIDINNAIVRSNEYEKTEFL